MEGRQSAPAVLLQEPLDLVTQGLRLDTALPPGENGGQGDADMVKCSLICVWKGQVGWG